MYAIIETGGKQYKVKEGDVVRIEKLHANDGDKVDFEKVLAIINGDNTKFGAPLVEGAKVAAIVQRQGKDKKIIIFKYKPKKNYRLKQGHRQPFTEVKIEKITG